MRKIKGIVLSEEGAKKTIGLETGEKIHITLSQNLPIYQQIFLTPKFAYMAKRTPHLSPAIGDIEVLSNSSSDQKFRDRGNKDKPFPNDINQKKSDLPHKYRIAELSALKIITKLNSLKNSCY